MQTILSLVDKKNLKKKTPRQQGHISLLNHVYVSRTHEKNRRKNGTHKNKELVVSMLSILLDVIRHFEDPRMYKFNVKYKRP